MSRFCEIGDGGDPFDMDLDDEDDYDFIDGEEWE